MARSSSSGGGVGEGRIWQSSIPPSLRKPRSSRQGRSSSARGADASPALASEAGAGLHDHEGTSGAEGDGRMGGSNSSYAVKYFGVAHGQLGVLTRRRYLHGGPPAEREAPGPPGGAGGRGGGDDGGVGPSRVDVEASAATGQSDDILHLVEDCVGGIWVPNGMVYGKQLKSFKKYSPGSSKGAGNHLHPEANLPRPAQYQSHNALAGWMLSPVKQPTAVMPGNAHAVRAATPPQRNVRRPSNSSRQGRVLHDPALSVGPAG